jgi:hypothetical protein
VIISSRNNLDWLSSGKGLDKLLISICPDLNLLIKLNLRCTTNAI